MKTLRPTSYLAALLGLVLTGCTKPAPDPKTPAQPRVALVLKTLNNPFFIDMQKGAQEAATRLGVDLVVGTTGWYDRIEVVIVDTRVDVGAAAEAGIRLDGFVGSDNYEGGKLAGEYLIQVTGGRARVGLLEGIPGHETGDSRLKGFHDAVKGAPGVKVVASQTANWERDQGFTVFQNMLQAHPEIDALFACSDMMALGAVEAIAAAGKTGQIRVIGFDAVGDARQAIAAGTMLGSVAQFPSEMGRLAVEDALKLIRGEKPEAEQKVRIELVTKATLSEK